MKQAREQRTVQISLLGWTFEFSLPRSRLLIVGMAVAIALFPLFVPASDEASEGGSAAADAAPPEEIPLRAHETARERRRRHRNRDISSAFRAAFHGGDESDLVHLETREETALFESWRSAAELREVSGLALFRLGDARDGVTHYRLALGGDQVVGIVRIRNRDDAWEVVGAERLAGEQQALDAERRRVFRMAQEKNRER